MTEWSDIDTPDSVDEFLAAVRPKDHWEVWMEDWDEMRRQEEGTLPRSPAYAECDTAVRWDAWVVRNKGWIIGVGLALILFGICLAMKD
jgi:hypothetical protein